MNKNFIASNIIVFIAFITSLFITLKWISNALFLSGTAIKTSRQRHTKHHIAPLSNLVRRRTKVAMEALKKRNKNGRKMRLITSLFSRSKKIVLR